MELFFFLIIIILFLPESPSIRILWAVQGLGKSNQAFKYIASLLKALGRENFTIQLWNYFIFLFIIPALCSMFQLKHYTHNYADIMYPALNNVTWHFKCLKACQRSFQRASVYEIKGETKKVKIMSLFFFFLKNKNKNKTRALRPRSSTPVA